MTGRDVPMSLRRLVVEVDTEDLNVRQFCAQHGISTWFFYDLRRRFAAGGWAAIEPRPRAPHRVANRTSHEVEDTIVALRKELTETGLDAGAATIAFHLHARGIKSAPSESTIWRVLSRRGFVVSDPSKAPKRAARRFAAERANECWQLDDTAWALADGTEVKIINIIDDCTRVAPACLAVPTATAAAIFEAFTAGAERWGWPERVLWDNARAHHALTDTLGSLGIGTGHSRPHHPQTCGKVERFHQTEHRYLAAQDAPEDLEHLQAQLDAFRQLYNHERPHRALHRRLPADVWASTPKSGPAPRSLGARTEIRRVRADRNGVVSLGRRYMISLGVAYSRASTIIVVTGAACHVFVDGRLARQLTLDPTRRVQPLYKKHGRPPRKIVRDAPRHQ
jgi:transposase InsO family protein